MSEIITEDFKNTITKIKTEIRNTQIKTMQHVNSELIMMYFRIGKILAENSADDIYFIKNIETELKLEFPNLKGFSGRNLRSMRLFYEEYKDSKTWKQVVSKLSWGHNILLMSKIKNKDVRMVYANAALKNGWSRNVLAMQIEARYHKRIGNSTNNFTSVLPSEDSDMINNIIKDPYIFDFLALKENCKEKELEEGMINKIRDVLLELGNGFAYVGNQYKISTENNDYYIDLLFYHLDLRRYVVVELKTTELKPYYIGQLSFYVAAVNEILKRNTDNDTIGLLLCKTKDEKTTRWSLKSTNLPIGVSSYEIKKYLPTDEDLNLHI